MSCAVNLDYARMSAPVAEGDDVAFLPPVSGGSRASGRWSDVRQAGQRGTALRDHRRGDGLAGGAERRQRVPQAGQGAGRDRAAGAGLPRLPEGRRRDRPGRGAGQGRRRGDGGARRRGADRPGDPPRRVARRDQGAAPAQGSERREERHPRDSRRHRRRGGRQLRRRPLPDVQPLRRAPGLEDGHDVAQRGRPRHPRGDRQHRGPARLQPAQVRERRASRAARARHRGQRPHPHLHGHRGRAARSRGGRRADRGQGPAHRHLLLQRAGRAEREHHLFGGAHHPSARPGWSCRSRTRSRRSRTARRR